MKIIWFDRLEFLPLVACFVISQITLLIQSNIVFANEVRGFMAGEARVYPEGPLHSGQENHSGSIITSPEYFHEFENRSLFTFNPFYRWDSTDKERTHFDVRDLSFIWLQKDWELRFGVSKVFWGVTESQHLVDIINQTDLVESPDLEEKLGQPMVNLSISRDWGIFDVFVLPYFRERTFPGRGGRLRSSLPIDTDQVAYESGAEEWHTDFAFRYFNSINKLDIGLSHFVGTGREPTILLGLDGNGNPFLFPRYEQINQTGLDALYVIESWILKLEAIYRSGQGPDDFFASTVGLEYTFDGILGTGMDLGFLGEWLYDERGDNATSPFENDITVGVRLAVNDVESTEILAALIQDVGSEARLFFLEASTLLTEHWRVSLEFRAFLNQPADDLLIDLRDDDFFQFELAYYF